MKKVVFNSVKFLILLGVLIFILDVFVSCFDYIRKWKIEADIRANLYSGVTLEEVEKYLTDEKFNYSVYEDGNITAARSRNISKGAKEVLTIKIYFNFEKKVDNVSIDFSYAGW